MKNVQKFKQILPYDTKFQALIIRLWITCVQDTTKMPSAYI